MSEQAPKEPVYDGRCIVCMKSVRDGDALVHFPFEERYITVCCPLCYEAFKTDPQTYLGRHFLPSKVT